MAVKPLKYEQVTGLNTVKTLTVPDRGIALVLLQAEAQDVRWTDDGSNPSASVGMILKAAQPHTEYDGDPTKLKFIEAAATAKLNVTYYAE